MLWHDVESDTPEPMSRRSKHSQNKNRYIWFVLGAVALILVIVLPVTLVHKNSSNSSSPPPSSSPSTNGGDASLITFNADAYTDEVSVLLSRFNSFTGIPTAPAHPGGSFGLAKQIQSQGCQTDVFLPVALSAAAPSNLGECSSEWTIGIGADEMVIAYAAKTASTTQATTSTIQLFQNAQTSNSVTDWNAAFSQLTSGNVKVGIANPALDPAGLRGWLVLQAAGYFYGASNQYLYADHLIQAGANVTAPAAENMVASMESGDFQFLFLYRSAATGLNLPYLLLEPQVNLGDPALASTYSKFTYQLPNGLNKGGPIVLSMTIPKRPPHPDQAQQFVQYVVDNVGSLSPFGMKPISPPVLYNNTMVPSFLDEMLARQIIKQGGLLGN